MSVKVFTTFIFCSLMLLAGKLPAQLYKVSGIVTDSASQPLSFVSIKVNGSSKGTTTTENGSFILQLHEGNQQLEFSIIGYKTKIVTLSVSSDITQNVVMEEENMGLAEVQVIITKKDKAEEIIENVIKQKQANAVEAQNYSCNVYIKATEESDRIGKSIKVLSRPIKKQPDIERMSMAEVLLKLDYAYPDKTREERVGVKLRGNTNNLFFLTTAQGDFNFYKNLVKVPALTQIPMLSPISYSGLVAYKFKTLNIRKENGRKIYTIKVIPSQAGNALVQGEVEVMDSAWVLLSTHFEFPQYHLIEYDKFSVDQQYELINDKAWLPVRQEFNYSAKIKKDKVAGRTVAIYHDYVIDTSFSRNHFSVEVSSTANEAYNRNDSFWISARRESLTEKEFSFVESNDSAYRVTHSQAYLDSVDRDYNRITLPKVIFYGQGIYNRSKERTITLPPLINIIKPFQLGGVRIAVDATYNKIYPNKKSIFVRTDLSYGIRNTDIKGRININRLYDPFHWSYFIINAGREFSYIYGNDSWVSSFRRSNIYEKYSLSVENGTEVANGLYITNNLEFAARNSIENYKFNAKFDTLFRGAVTNNNPIAFDPYNAVYNNLRISYTPHQLYRREPKQKVNLGSKWPTFSVLWRKGVPGILNSKINFDYLEFMISQKLKLGLVGISEYSLTTGSFINAKKVGFVDYKYMRRGDPLLFTEPSRNFQALDSTFPMFNRFYEGHYIHNFNGNIINRINAFKKLKISEIAGGGILILPEKDLQYAEAFAGLEKILQVFNEKIKIGAYVVGSVANKFNNPLQFKIALQYYNRTTKQWH